MKQIKNIKEFIETEYEDGYVIHITWDEVVAIESALETEIDVLKEDDDPEKWFPINKQWFENMIELREEMLKTLQEVRRNENN